MTLDGVSLAEFNIRATGSVEQDQPAHTCSLILLYTLRKLNPWSLGSGLTLYFIDIHFKASTTDSF